MDKQRDILTQIDHRDGMTVPEDYFASFVAKMTESLPSRDEAENPAGIILPPPTLWTRIRPYVYMAAMFAGVWCMLKMFSLMATPSDANSDIDRNPVLAEALRSDSFISDYIIDDISQWDLIDEMIEDGVDASVFEIPADSDNDVFFIDPAAVIEPDQAK